MRKITLFLTLNFMSFIGLLAQPNNAYVKNITMPTPNAASLGKYGDIPVSYYTGVPNINLPIHTINQGPLSHSISINYHASGLKVAEPSSWIGTGWSLQAGGIVSRTVQGIKDEDLKGYYYHGTQIPSPTNQCEFNTYAQLVGYDHTKGDSEPDIFSFNAGEYNGKFYLDPNNADTIVLVPQQDIKIKLHFSGSQTSLFHLNGFTITTPDGVKFLYGEHYGEQAIEVTQGDGNAPKVSSSWYLRAIESHDGKHWIRFSYEDENFSQRFRKSNFGDCSGSNSFSGSPNLISLTEGKRLKTITSNSSTETITFQAGADRDDLEPHIFTSVNPPKRLDFIKINSGSFNKIFDFDYDYWNDNSSYAGFHPHDNKRLRLLSLTEKSDDNSIINPPHVFEYQNLSSDPNFLPNKLTRAVDHWGFYNGADSNNDFSVNRLNIPPTLVTIPDPDICGSYRFQYWIGESDRNSNEPSMLLGSLKKITYPTGGHTEFEFEANTVYGPDTLRTNTEKALVSRSYPYPGKCGLSTDVAFNNTIFSSQSEINESEYYYSIQEALTCDCNNSPSSWKAAYFRVRNQNTNMAVDSTGWINLNCNNQVSITNAAALTTIFPNLQPNVPYRFEIVGEDCAAIFKVYHVAQTISTANHPVGGLRVKKIRSHDGLDSSKDIVKSYDYSKPNIPAQSSSILYNKPVYDWTWIDYGCPGVSPCGTTTNGCTPPVCSPGSGSGVWLFDISITPLGSFEGYHLGYEYVKENFEDGTAISGNGYNQYTYNVEPPTGPPTPSDFPYPPAQIRTQAGNIRITSMHDDAGNQKQKDTNFPYYEPYTNSSDKMFKIGNSCYGGFNITPYQIRTRPAHRLLYKQTVLDGVSTTTNFEYSSTDHFFPTAEYYVDSKSDEIRTEYEYPFTYGNINSLIPTYPTGNAITVGNALVSRNIINTPWLIRKKVNGIQVDGSAIGYDIFNGNPRPKHYMRYEKTWDSGGNLTGTGYKIRGTVNGYNSDGFVSSFTNLGWSPETYQWTPDGRITQRKYLNFVWNYDYYSGTKLLKTITDKDGQKTEFEYDALMRLKKNKARNDNVFVDYDYHFKDPNNVNDKNYVNTKTTFTATTGSSLTNLETRQYLDGLGRPIQNVKIGYSPSGGDVIEAVEYDNQGRVKKQYVPSQSLSSNGGYSPVLPNAKFTLTDYEASPLNRATSVTPPGWYATTSSYGKNGNSEVLKSFSPNAYYAAGELNKTVVIDPNGNEMHTFSDKKGRTVLSRKKKGNLKTDTYTEYDDKDRISMILPSGATLNTPELLYKYRYDQADNSIWKKIPGKGEEEMLYNTKDLMTYYRDANMKLDGHWKLTWYDAYGQPYLNRLVNQANYPSSGNAYTSSVAQYIDYTSYNYNGTGANLIKMGKPNWTRVRNVENNALMYRQFFYDSYGRVSWDRGMNQFWGSWGAERTNYAYDNADNILQTKRTHRKNGGAPIMVIDQTHTYDHSGRLEATNHKIGSGPNVLLSQNEYNLRDFLTKKNLHGVPGGDFLQNVDYTYNDQGWLKKINDLSCMNNGGGSGSSAAASGASGLVARIELNPREFSDDSDAINFKIHLEVQVVSKDGDSEPKTDTKYVKVTGLSDGKPEVNISDDDKVGTRFEKVYTFDKSNERIEVGNFSDFLKGLEDEIIQSLEEEMAFSYLPIITTQLQEIIEKAIPFSAQEYLETAGKSTVSQDLFAMTLAYDIPNSAVGALSQKNGNISSAIWQVGCNDPHVYGYQYDYLDRIKQAKYANIDKNNLAYKNHNYYNMDSVTYDARGNLQRMYRRGHWLGISYINIDYLTYFYNAGSNQLNKVKEHHYLKQDGFKTISTNYANSYISGYYTYDANGNVISDDHKGISNIDYNYLNLPKKITYDNGNWIEWNYDSHGRKLKKTTSDGSIKYYSNGIEYTSASPDIDAIYHSEGRAKNISGTYQYEYNLKDHLGNTRVTFADLDNSNTVDETEILEQNAYYPFGMVIEGISSTSSGNKYLYNGKELNEDFGLDWLDYGARWYDPALGRWGQIDPLAESMASWSPYNYTFNNPLRYTDPDGKVPVPLVTGAIGAGVGFVVGGAAQAVGSWWRGESVSLKEVGKAAVAGGVAGGVVGSGAALFGGGLAATAGVGVVSGVAGETTSQSLDMVDGTREVGDFDGEAILFNGAISGPLNVVAAGAGQGLKGALTPSAKETVKAAQKQAGKAVKQAGGTKAELQAAKSAAKKEAKATQLKTETIIQASAQGVSGTINGSVRSTANSKLENNE